MVKKSRVRRSRAMVEGSRVKWSKIEPWSTNVESSRVK